jgi:hypothetical protein
VSRGQRWRSDAIASISRSKPSDRSDGDVVRGEAELRPDPLLDGAVAAEGAVVDAVQHHAHAVAVGAVAHQLGPDLARHGNRHREGAQQLLVERVVEAPLAGAVPGPAVRRGQRHDPLGAAEEQREQVGLVVV